jgi:hypothetical protein
MTKDFSIGKRDSSHLWRTWLLWVAVSALVPALSILQWIFMQRLFGRHFEGQSAVVLLVILLAAAIPAILQWAVLRRLVADLSFPFWVGGTWVWTIAALFFLAWFGFFGDGERAFRLAQLRGEFLYGWFYLTLYGAAVGLIFNFGPIAFFGAFAHRRWLGFLIATIVGGCAALLIYWLNPYRLWYTQYSFFYPVDFNRAQAAWRELISFATTFIMLGTLQGAIGGWGLMRMFARAPEAPEVKQQTSGEAPL